MTQAVATHEMISMDRLVDTIQRLSLAKDIQDVMEIVRVVARELTGADGATFILRDGDLCYYADEDALSPLWKGCRFPMEACISGWVMLNKVPAVIEDIYADERIPADAYRPTFVKSLAMVPIRRGKPLGAIGNYWAATRTPSPEEVALLQSLADITAVSIENIEIRNRLQEQVEERSQMLNLLQKQKTKLEDFTQIIAHNMRAPLVNLMLLADMSKEAEDMEELLGYTDQQRTVLQQLHQTFEELVDSINVNSHVSIKRDDIDLEQCFRKNVELQQSEILRAGAKISTDFSSARTVRFPRHYMDSIIFNLLSNAIKYSSPDRSPEVSLRSFKDKRFTCLQVADNGLGIDLNRHGKDLFKLQKTFHDHPLAKGFGLYITKTQVEAMGGEIDVESRPGEGTTFTLKLCLD